MRIFSAPKPQERLSLVTSIQFVVELEFLTPPVSDEQTVPDRDRSFHYFASALQDAGLQAAFLLEEKNKKEENYPEVNDQVNDNDRDTDGQMTESQLLAQAPRGSIIKTKHNGNMFIMSPQSSIPWIKAGAKDNPLLRYWLINPDSNISGHGQHETWHPTALTSPILRESEANNLFPGLNTAIYTIWTAHSARVHINDACGLHVHVSPAVRQDLTTLQVQRVATLVVVLENSLLFHLCSPHRRQIHTQLIAASGLAYATNSPTCPLAEANLPPNILKGTGAVEKAIKFLWTASDLDQISQMLSRHPKTRDTRPTALRINTHKHEDDTVSHMLEFRHAQAAFNQGFVDNWVRLVLTVCKVAFLPTERFKLVVAML
ncbi:hypothetical protein M431DRAFT_81327 [Trichoderma harzianum CBS 226.95]|uniref:Amidoligase enzyme n=1 Tax=Trichoderma harzianum CBS 226.95 TaxID=983964 RepID=A0A2T4AIT8_TRIHA|nr:hypothetical protein M431DRAFT_81327 [Trichoderma harzianum CBS 226.95]PTB56989.1 hypothetical protein M431DRAFT_81327 [Trichoderma harzianum CBS 226.95]